MRIRINWVVTAFTSLSMLAVSAVLFFAGLRTDPRMMTDDGLLPLKTFFFLMSAFFLLLTLLINGGILLYALIKNRRIKNLEASGIKGTATILQMRDTGIMVNNQPQVWIEMQVDLPGRSPIFLEKRQVISYYALGHLHVGGTINVLADPEKLGQARGFEIILND